MNRVGTILLIISLAAMTSCSRGIDSVRQAADSARNASEQVAYGADEANRNREAKVLADAEAIEQIARAKTGAPDGTRQQYELHKDNVGDSWTIYDTANGRALKIGPKTQSGLSHDEAEAALATLSKQSSDDNALFARLR